MSPNTALKKQSPFPLSGFRVLQVVPTMSSGGVEKTTLEIAHALLKAGSVPYIATRSGVMIRPLVALGVQWCQGSFNTKNPLKIISNTFKLYGIIKRHKISLVHARSRAPAWSAYWAARLAGIPFITTFHGTYNGVRGLKKVYNSIMTKGVLVIANSQFIKSHIQTVYRVCEQKIRVIPRGVDPERFVPKERSLKRLDLFEQWGFSSQDRRPCFILPGRLTPWKGQWFFIESLRGLSKKDYRAVIVGDCQGRLRYKSELFDKIESLGLSDTVKIVPPVVPMEEVLPHGVAVVSASQDPEAFGRIMVEALSLEIPVIAPAHGGALEIIDPTETGFLFSPHVASSLQEKLKILLSMSEKDRHRMGKKGRARVLRDFTTEAMCQKTLSVYEEILKGNKTGD